MLKYYFYIFWVTTYQYNALIIKTQTHIRKKRYNQPKPHDTSQPIRDLDNMEIVGNNWHPSTGDTTKIPNYQLSPPL